MKSCISVRRDNALKDNKDRIMNEDEWDHNVEGDTVESLVDCECRDEVVQVLNENRKSPSTFICIIAVDCS